MLDKDGDGKLSRAEFEAGLELFDMDGSAHASLALGGSDGAQQQRAVHSGLALKGLGAHCAGSHL